MIPPLTNGVKDKVNTEKAQRVKKQQTYLSWKRGEEQPVHYGYKLRSHTSAIEGYKNCAEKHLLAQHIFAHKPHQIYNEYGKRLSIDVLLSGEHSENR